MAPLKTNTESKVVPAAPLLHAPTRARPLFPPHQIAVKPAYTKAMAEWEHMIDAKHPEENAIVVRYFDQWVSAYYRGEPVPAPTTKHQRIAADGFRVFVNGLVNAGVQI